MSAMIMSPTDGRVLEVLGDRVVIKSAGSDTEGRFALLEFTSPKGGGAPPHRHPWREGYWVLEGEFEFFIDGERRKFTPGSWLVVPPGAAHTLKALTDSARYLMFAEPAGVEACLIDIQARTASDPTNIEKIVQIAGEHGIELAG